MKYIILLALLIPGIATASFDTSLKYGSKGASVVELQEFLIDQGCLNSEATGNFYSLTLKAVKCFQQAHALPVTGYFGPMSRGIANAILTVETASSTQEEIIDTGTSTPVVIATTTPTPVATTTIIQYITYNTPASVQTAPTPTMTVGAVAPKTDPVPVRYSKLYTGSNDIYHFTKDTDWTYFTAKYSFKGERISLVSLGVYPDEPDSKMLSGLPTFEKGDFSFISAVPFPAGKYVVRVIIAGAVSNDAGQKVSMWTNDTDMETIENK